MKNYRYVGDVSGNSTPMSHPARIPQIPINVNHGAITQDQLHDPTTPIVIETPPLQEGQVKTVIGFFRNTA